MSPLSGARLGFGLLSTVAYPVGGRTDRGRVGLAATYKVTERRWRRAPRPEPTRGRAQLAIEPRMLLALGGRANVANAFRPNKTQGAYNEMGRATALWRVAR